MAVNSVNMTNMLPPMPTDAGASRGGSMENFSSLLSDQIKQTDRLQKEAKDLGERAMLGNAGVSIHEAQIAAARADLHLRFLMQVRNKAVEVYREVMSMPA